MSEKGGDGEKGRGKGKRGGDLYICIHVYTLGVSAYWVYLGQRLCLPLPRYGVFRIELDVDHV